MNKKIFFKLQNNVDGLILGTYKCDERSEY